MIGSCLAIASRYALTITCEPSTPSAPLLIVASDAKTTTLFPLMAPVAAIIPQSVRSSKSESVPGSSRRWIRSSGSLGSTAALTSVLTIMK